MVVLEVVVAVEVVVVAVVVVVDVDVVVVDKLGVVVEVAAGEGPCKLLYSGSRISETDTSTYIHGHFSNAWAIFVGNITIHVSPLRLPRRMNIEHQ